MTILGIDPGIASMGYGVIGYDGIKCRMLEYGVLSTKPDMPMPQRLASLFEGLTDLQNRHQPDDVAVEELFFGTNVKTAIVVGEARGVALTAAALHTRNIYEYTPPQIKQAITGYGRADKGQVQRMVMALLQLKDVPRPDDAADGLAVAICHAHSLRARDRFLVK